MKKVDNKQSENCEKIYSKGSRYKVLLDVFIAKFHEITGTRYKFQDKRTTQAGKLLRSDVARFITIFTFIQSKSKNDLVVGEIISLIMESWSEWDKAHPLNLVGFIENQCNEDEIGKFFMKANKNKKNKKSLHNEDHRKDTVEKHRSMFD